MNMLVAIIKMWTVVFAIMFVAIVRINNDDDDDK